MIDSLYRRESVPERDKLKGELLGYDDPMHEYFTKKNMEIKLKTEIVYPTYKGQFPDNRYGIPPGYRWDGLDRSNGFEKRLILRGNERKADASNAYRAYSEQLAD